MKIGIVCPYNMFQFSGGVQEIVINVEKRLSAMGHEVKIITPRPVAHDDIVDDTYILVGRSTKVNTIFDTMADIGIEADSDEIQAILDNEQFDILHFHEPWVPLLSYQILSKSTSINIATFHAKLPESILSRSIMNTIVPYTKSLLKYIHAYTAVSPAATEHIRTLTDEPITIVPNGIDLTRFTEARRALPKKDKTLHSKKTILYLGRLEKRKGVEYLIKAYARLRETRDDVQLHIAGNGVKKSSLMRLVAMHEVPDVEFLGYIPESDKPLLMAQADVFCSPAPYGESFGIVLLEAMALGVPVVAGNNGGYSSVMQGKGRLSLVTPQVTDDFAQRLELMLFDEDVRGLWRTWALRAVQQYDYSLIADQYEAVYKKAMRIYA